MLKGAKLITLFLFAGLGIAQANKQMIENIQKKAVAEFLSRTGNLTFPSGGNLSRIFSTEQVERYSNRPASYVFADLMLSGTVSIRTESCVGADSVPLDQGTVSFYCNLNVAITSWNVDAILQQPKNFRILWISYGNVDASGDVHFADKLVRATDGIKLVAERQLAIDVVN